MQALMMAVGSSLWAYIIAAGCGIVSTLNPTAEEHRRSIGRLRYFVKERGISGDLVGRLHAYFNQTSHLRHYESNSSELMASMTDQLRGETAHASAKVILLQCTYLRAATEPAFLTRAALALTRAVYCPKELVPCDQLTFITRGLVAKLGRIGVKVIGQDMILDNPALRDLAPASAVTLAHVSRLSRGDLLALVAEYPVQSAIIRKARYLLLLQRMLLRTAQVASEMSRPPSRAMSRAGRASPAKCQMTLVRAFDEAHRRVLQLSPTQQLGLDLGRVATQTTQGRGVMEGMPAGTGSTCQLERNVSALQRDFFHLEKDMSSFMEQMKSDMAEVRAALTGSFMVKKPTPSQLKSRPPPLKPLRRPSSSAHPPSRPPSRPPSSQPPHLQSHPLLPNESRTTSGELTGIGRGSRDRSGEPSADESGLDEGDLKMMARKSPPPRAQREASLDA